MSLSGTAVCVQLVLSGLNFENHVIVVYPGERHVRQDPSGQNEELASDIKYILQTLTGMDERLQKLETSSNQGNGTAMKYFTI